MADSNSAVRLLLRRNLGVERLLILCAIKRTTRRWPIQGHGLSLEVRVGDSGLLRRLPLHALGWTRQVSLHLPTCNASLRVSLYFGTRRGLEQAFNSLDVAAGDLHHVFREPESGGRGIAAAIAAGPRSRAPKSRCIRARIPVLASLPLVPRNQDIEHRRETSHRKPCGVIRAPRRPLTLDEQPELLPKEKIHCGEGAARAAQGCERMRQRPGQ